MARSQSKANAFFLKNSFGLWDGCEKISGAVWRGLTIIGRVWSRQVREIIGGEEGKWHFGADSRRWPPMGADSRRTEGMGSASIGSYRHLGGNGGVGYRHLSALRDGSQRFSPPADGRFKGDSVTKAYLPGCFSPPMGGGFKRTTVPSCILPRFCIFESVPGSGGGTLPKVSLVLACRAWHAGTL